MRLATEDCGEALKAGFSPGLFVLQNPNKYSTKQKTLKQKDKNFKCLLNAKNSFSCYFGSSFISKKV